MTADELARIHFEAFGTEKAWTAATFSGLLADPSVLVSDVPHSFVLGRVVVDEAEILTLATDPAHQRQGRATEALNAFVKLAAESGATTLFLEVATDNAAALALYRACGFREVGRRSGYYARKDKTSADALILRRDLP